MQEETEDLVLTKSEREALLVILQRFLLYQSYLDAQGHYTKRCMRKQIIWINQRDFLKNNPKPSGVKGLLRKHVLTPHVGIGYKIIIKEEYVSQIYNLLDNGDWELVIQLGGIWLEVAQE